MRLLCSLVLVIFGFSFQAIASQGNDNSQHSKVIAQKTVRACLWPEYNSITYPKPKTQHLSGLNFDTANESCNGLRATANTSEASYAYTIKHGDIIWHKRINSFDGYIKKNSLLVIAAKNYKRPSTLL